jgi:hypothetical protein
MRPTFLLFAALLLGCPQPQTGAGGGGGAPPPNFTLQCRSASTATSRNVHCIRTDTRSGAVERVALDKIPVSQGPTAVSAAPAGRYQTSCIAAQSDTQADFYCVRINTDSGEMLMINLQKVPTIP